MTRIDRKLLQGVRKLYLKISGKSECQGRDWKRYSNKEYASELIRRELSAEKPSMIARLGYTELACLVNYLGVSRSHREVWRYLRGEVPQWWWNENIVQQMQMWSGFFPTSSELLERFSLRMIKDMREVDILGSWLREELFFRRELEQARMVVLEDLEPFFCRQPWTWILEGKNVLIVHPFTETIRSQYRKRELLFDNGLLPPFELQLLKAVQSLGGEQVGFSDWFSALKHMEDEIDRRNYDICIIGCGAYGFPLAAHVKRRGKKAIHLGGVTQLLFGIKGSRWEEYIVWPYRNLFNEHWVRPKEQEQIGNSAKVEGACYW